MRRLTLVVLISLPMLAEPASGQKESGPSPNILFLFADDMRRDTIAALGNPWIHSPNLDRLVREGFAFTNNYCMGSRHGAVCAPSRAMLMSGRSLPRVTDNLEGVKTLGETLASAGYVTFGSGKWHNGQASFIRSFRYGQSVMFDGMSDHRRVPIVDLNAEGDAVLGARRGKDFSSRLFADATIRFLQEQAKQRSEQPFFAYVAFTAPHDPRDPPAEFRRLYAEKKPPLPPNFRPQHGWNIDLETLTLRDEVLAAWPRDPETIRDQIAEYYGLISHLDAEIGRILAALEDSGLAENTLVIFTADHGLAMGSHGLLGKQNLYEHSMGCPLVLQGPGVPAGGSSFALTYLFDLFPTICEVAGAELPDAVEGQSLMPIVRGERESLRSSLFTLYRDNQRALRDERFKLIRFTKTNKTMLFDLEVDPHELADLSGDPEQASRVASMLELMEDWQAEIDDQQALVSEDPLPLQIDLSDRPRKPDRHQPAWIREKYFDPPTEKKH